MPRELPEHVKREREGRARWIELAERELQLTQEFRAKFGAGPTEAKP
jgi:hypothetical protein